MKNFIAVLCPQMIGFAKYIEDIRIFNYFRKEKKIITLFHSETSNAIQEAFFTECLKIERLIYKMEVITINLNIFINNIIFRKL